MKIAIVGISTVFLALYAIMLAMTIMNDVRVRQDVLLHITVAMSVVSLMLSLSVYYDKSVANLSSSEAASVR